MTEEDKLIIYKNIQNKKLIKLYSLMSNEGFTLKYNNISQIYKSIL